MDLKLKGQRALITGGTKGIGRAIADLLADEGCNVAICARNAEEVDAAVKALTAKGVTAFGQSVDVGDGDALKAWVAASAAALGGVDILVSNVSGGNAPGEAGWRANFEYDVIHLVWLSPVPPVRNQDDRCSQTDSSKVRNVSKAGSRTTSASRNKAKAMAQFIFCWE